MSDELTVMRVCEIPSRTSTHRGHSTSPSPPREAATTCKLVSLVNSIYRMTHLLADWVMLPQFRLGITSVREGIDVNIT